MLSILEQITSYVSAPAFVPEHKRPERVRRPSEARLNEVYALVRDSPEPVQSEQVRAALKCAKSLAQDCLRILHDEQGRIMRIKNGPRGAKRYVVTQP